MHDKPAKTCFNYQVYLSCKLTYHIFETDEI